jgi:hypothetical protein
LRDRSLKRARIAAAACAHPLGRLVTGAEIANLQDTDPGFSNRELTMEGSTHKRSDWALVARARPNWNFFDLVQVRDRSGTNGQPNEGIVGDKPVRILEAV